VLDVNERVKFLVRAFGEPHVSRDGVNIYYKCPSCGKNPEKKKLVVRIDTEKWHCWVCDIKGGTIASLLRKYSPSLVAEWRKNFGSPGRLSYDDDPVDVKERIEFPEMHSLDELRGMIDPDAKAILSYLKKRGVSYETAYRFRLCGSIRGSARRRVVFPSFDADGNPNYWTARSVEDVPKFRYLNPKADRGEIVFNEIDVDWDSELVVVEGPFDMLNAGENSVPLLGSSLSNSSLLFRRIVENSTPVVLALDNDMKKKSHEIAKKLNSYDVRVRMLDTGSSKDIGDMSREEFVESLHNAKEWSREDRLSFLINRISSGSII
jgi:hypothetical protein